MAKYSAFKYSAAKYGQGEQDANLLWGFTVAWDGFYGWGNEANRMTSLRVKRGRQALTDKNGIVPFGIGEAVGIFDNTDGRYDPYNTSSPLYGNITPGKFVRIVVRDEANTTTYGVMRGTIADIQPIRIAGKEQVRISVVDGLQTFRDNTVNIGLNQAIEKYRIPLKLADAIDWDYTEWPDGVEITTPTHAYWWAWNQNALDALTEFNAAEWAVTFHSRDGELVSYQNDYPHLRQFTLDEDDLLDEIGRPQPWDVVRNVIRMNVSTQVLDPINAIIWALQDTPSIADGAEFYIEALFKYEEWRVCGSSVTFNHTVNAQADGGGADLTADCPLTYNTDIGEGAQITITNNSGSTGYVILLTATGDAIYSPYINVIEISDSESQAAYGKRVLNTTGSGFTRINFYNFSNVQDTDYAYDLATWLLSELKDPAQYPIIQMEDQPTRQFYLDLYDQVNLIAPTLSIYHSFRVGSIEHQTIGEGCQGVRTVMRLEPYMQFGGETMVYQGVRAYLATASQETATTVAEAIEFNAESHDITGYHDNAVNPDRLTVPTGYAGYYRIYTQVKWEIDGGAAGLRILYIKKNGGATAIHETVVDATDTNMVQYSASCHYLDEGDYVQVEAYQNSGGALDVEWGAGNTYFGIDYLGA